MASTLTAWNSFDTATDSGRCYAYVVEARDVSADRCTGLVRVCLEPCTVDAGKPPLPGGVFARLRARHDGNVVAMLWRGTRALLAGDEFVLLKAAGSPTNSASAPPGATSGARQDAPA